MKRLNTILALFILIISTPWHAVSPGNRQLKRPQRKSPSSHRKRKRPIETEAPTEEITPSATAYTCPAGLTAMTAFSVEFCYPSTLATGVAQAMIPRKPTRSDERAMGLQPGYD